MIEVHKYVGFFVVALFTVGWVWGLMAWIAKRNRGAASGLGDGGAGCGKPQALMACRVRVGQPGVDVMHYARLSDARVGDRTLSRQ